MCDSHMVGWYARSSIDFMGARDAFPIPLYIISGVSRHQFESERRNMIYKPSLSYKYAHFKRDTTLLVIYVHAPSYEVVYILL